MARAIAYLFRVSRSPSWSRRSNVPAFVRASVEKGGVLISTLRRINGFRACFGGSLYIVSDITAIEIARHSVDGTREPLSAGLRGLP